MLATTRASLAGFNIVVACDMRGANAPLPAGCDVASDGLGDARNDLVVMARLAGASLLAVFDDDVAPTPSGIEKLRAAMAKQPEIDLLAGVYTNEEMLAHTFLFEDRVMTLVPVDTVQNSAIPSTVDFAQNAFVVKLDALDELPWDDRAKMQEHELFFLKLFMRNKRVTVLPSAKFEHLAMPADDLQFLEYQARRHDESAYLGVLCLNFPKVFHVVTPSFRLDCITKRVTLPMQTNKPLPLEPWSAEDRATIQMPPISTSVLFVCPVHANAHVQRQRLREGWLTQCTDPAVCDWAFFTTRADGGETSTSGDIVQLKTDTVDSYDTLGVKVVAALRWAVADAEF